jgi:hypothetical protein
MLSEPSVVIYSADERSLASSQRHSAKRLELCGDEGPTVDSGST